MDRENFIEEQMLRKKIRKAIDIILEKKDSNKKKQLQKEKELRKVIRKLIAEAEKTEASPHQSTGINVLDDLLKKIIPVVEQDYKQLTTDPGQRESFRAHIINAVVNALTPAKTNNAAVSGDEEALQEVVDVDIGGEDEDKFIDIRTDAEVDADEEPADPRDEFGTGVEGEDETGRNMAYESFKKIESNVIDSYELLSDTEDQELFYDYLIANLKLYFDKFEGELSSEVSEPTNAAYDTAAAEAGAEETGGEEELEF